MALAIMGIAAGVMLSAFATHMDSNTRSEQRSGAIIAAEIKLEALRLEDVTAMPSSGISSPETVSVAGRNYQVWTRYCVTVSYCDDESRHLTVEVYFDGQRMYDVETVYTKVR